MKKPIESTQVFMSYNGKVGCMCGCLGKYTLPSHTSIVAANEHVGYDAYDESDVSDNRVKRAVTKINAALNMTEEQLKDHGIRLQYEEGVYAGVTSDTRTTVVYFK